MHGRGVLQVKDASKVHIQNLHVAPQDPEGGAIMAWIMEALSIAVESRRAVSVTV